MSLPSEHTKSDLRHVDLDEDDLDLNLLDSSLEERLKYDAVEVTIINSDVGTHGVENVIVKPLHKLSPQNKMNIKTEICSDADSLPEYIEIEDDEMVNWTLKTDSPEVNLDLGVDSALKEDGILISDDDLEEDAELQYSSKVDNLQLDDNTEIRQDSTEDRDGLSDQSNRELKSLSTSPIMNVSDNSRDAEMPNSPNVCRYEWLFDDDMMEQDTYQGVGPGKIQTDGIKKARPHPYMGKVVGKGKQSVSGKSTVKSSKKWTTNQPSITDSVNMTEKTAQVKGFTRTPQPMSRVSDPQCRTPKTSLTVPHARPRILEPQPRVSEPSPPLKCESCYVHRSYKNVVQCCEGHVVCTSCVEKEAKKVIVGAKKESVECMVPGCNSSIPLKFSRTPQSMSRVSETSPRVPETSLKALETLTDMLEAPPRILEPPPRVSEPSPPLKCESCYVHRSYKSVVQCCEGHVVCTSCVEKEAKKVIVGAKKESLECMVPGCNSSIPLKFSRTLQPMTRVSKISPRVPETSLKAPKTLTTVLEPQPRISEPPPRVTEPPPPMECESCKVIRSHNDVVQCCEGHVVCTSCVEKEAKNVIVGVKKGSVECSVLGCKSSIPLSELRKSLPGMVLDLLEESWKKETLEALENMKDGVKCPGCGYSGVLETSIKNFKCGNCQKTYCRLCEMEWHMKRHDLCVKMTNRVSEATGHAINIPAHWVLDIDREKEMGYSAVELDPLNGDYLDIVAHFSKSLSNDRFQVKKVYRIQNQRLWEKYSLFRTHMIQDMGELHINERRLFHGTHKDVIDNICKEGFDWRLSGKHGTMFGHGTYFAKDSSYSIRYSSSHGGNWSPSKQKKKTDKKSPPKFPPSYTQSMRFNVLTGQAPNHPTSSGNTPSSGTYNVFKFSGNSSFPFLNGCINGPVYGVPLVKNINKSESGKPLRSPNSSNSSDQTVTSSTLDSGNGSNTKLSSSCTIQSPGTPTTWTGFNTKTSSNDAPVISLSSRKATTSNSAGFGFGHGGCFIPSTSSSLFVNPKPSSSSSMAGNSFSIGSPSPGSFNFGSHINVLNNPPHNPPPSFQGFVFGGGSTHTDVMYIFVARVLVGRKCLGNPEMRRPGTDDQGRQCHTAVDNLNHSRIYVVFESGQCYPEYIIEYSKN